MIVKHKIIVLLALFIITGGFLHFYNLTWGAPFYFHPDERNIAASVAQLQFPKQLHPHFFAYGSLPIYIIYVTGIIINFLQHVLNPLPSPLNPTFEQAILISRFYSALFATLLIPLLFFIGKKLGNTAIGLVAAFLATTSVGFIQFAHFGTFEMWLTFFTTVLFWLCLQKPTINTLMRMGIVLGILVATKISSLILLPLLFFVIPLRMNMQKQRSPSKYWMPIVKNILLVCLTATIVYLLTNPFVFLDYHAFRASMDYESSLVIGTLPVFYTGEFYETLPILYQLLHVYPFLLNPLITILFLPSFYYLLVLLHKHKKPSLILLLSSLLESHKSE